MPEVITMKHGLVWILEGTTLMCPECKGMRSDIAWDIVDISPSDSKNIMVAAACRCGICGCEFQVYREDDGKDGKI